LHDRTESLEPRAPRRGLSRGAGTLEHGQGAVENHDAQCILDPMPMCAIYTAVPPPSAEQLTALARDNEARQYGANRRTLGPHAIEELVAAVAPPSHAEFAKAILERDLWGFLTPAATRGNHAAAIAREQEGVHVPSPVWPSSVELACLVGARPAHYIGNNLVMLSPQLVQAAVAAFAKLERDHEPAELLNEFLRAAAGRLHAVLLHWDYR